MRNIVGKSVTLRSKRLQRRTCNWYVSARRRLRIELLEDRRMLVVSPLGDEFLVNSYTSGTQQTWSAANAVRVGSAGDFDITFNGKGQDDSNGVFVRRFNTGGQPLGADQLVNQTTSGDQEDSSIAGAANGDFVVVWSGKGSGDNDGIFLQRYRANGTKNGMELLVNTTTDKKQEQPVVAMASDGRFVVAWIGDGTGDNDGVFLQRFNANGVRQGSEVRVNTTTNGKQVEPAVATAPDGRFAIAWSGKGSGDDDGIFVQRFNANGLRAGGEVLVNATTAGTQELPTIAYAEQGNFVVAWSGKATGNSKDIFFQRFSANGSTIGGQQTANSTSENKQTNPDIAIGADGSFVIVWTSNKQDGSRRGIFGREFSAIGQTVGGEFQVNTTSPGPQEFPSIAMNAAGGFVVAWSGRGVGDNDGVFARRYTRQNDTSPPAITAALTNDTGSSATDRLTSDPAIGGSIADTSDITSFRAGFDSTPVANFISVLPDLQPNKSFAFNAARLAAINGGLLAQGAHTLHLQATDAAGNVSSLFDVAFTLDTISAAVAASLTNDTGISSTDRLTLDPSISGSIAEANLITSFRAGFDSTPATSYINVLSDLQPNKSFAFNAARLAVINGGPLAQGAHTLHLQATDAAGSVSSLFDVAFTFDSLPPLNPSLALDSAFDTGTIGDRETTLGLVTLIGLTEATAAVKLNGMSPAISAGNDGRLAFSGVSLTLGDNTFVVQAMDAAGNSSELTSIIKRTAKTDPVID